MSQRRFKPRNRKSGVRDARLIIIAAEGEKTEPKYFGDLANHDKYRNSKVHVEVLKREEVDGSAPEWVIGRLDRFRKDYEWEDGDELWLVIDYDRWGEAKLSDIHTQCGQKGYLLALSNPCFEIWLLLHLTSLDKYSEVQLESFRKTGHPKTSQTPLEIELGNLTKKTYNKSNLNTELYMPHIETAIENAKAVDYYPNHGWVNGLGTRVYLLAASIINSKKPRS